jgi:hypothetical protein
MDLYRVLFEDTPITRDQFITVLEVELTHRGNETVKLNWQDIPIDGYYAPPMTADEALTAVWDLIEDLEADLDTWLVEPIDSPYYEGGDL